MFSFLTLPLTTPLKLIENFSIILNYFSTETLSIHQLCWTCFTASRGTWVSTYASQRTHHKPVSEERKEGKMEMKIDVREFLKVFICFRRKMNSADVGRVRRSSLRWFRKYGGEIDLRFITNTFNLNVLSFRIQSSARRKGATRRANVVRCTRNWTRS